MVVFKESKNKIKTVKPGDRQWHIAQGLYLTPRAGFEISQSCPKEYRMIINECINRSWLKPVAYMAESEFMWEELKNEINM
jgi:hypothetical protein